MNRVTLVAIVIVGLLFFFVIARFHDHFAEHAAQVAAAQAADQERRTETQEADRERATHEKHLAWQQAHPAEYAHQRAGAIAAAQRLERRHIVQERRAIEAAMAAEERHRKAKAAMLAAQEEQRQEESHLYHGTPDCLVLDNRTLTTESDESTWYIEGKVTNKCDHDLGYVQVEFNFYDGAGNQRASGLDNVNNLASGQTWAFKKAVYEVEGGGGTWRVVGLSGF